MSKYLIVAAIVIGGYLVYRIFTGEPIIPAFGLQKEDEKSDTTDIPTEGTVVTTPSQVMSVRHFMR